MKLVTFVAPLAVLALSVAPAFAQETRSFTDDAGRSVEIPVDPQRIASLQDLSITIPLIELGVYPVASHGRTTEAGEGFIRSSKVLTGVDFDNSDIEFLGNAPIDLEALAALEPDLIVVNPNWNYGSLEQVEIIAPTVVLDDTVRGDFGMYEALAEITGTTDTLAILKGRYDSQIEQIRRLIDTESISV